MLDFPVSNLPPDSQPWGRYVSDSISLLDSDSSTYKQYIDNNLTQLNSSIQLLSNQQAWQSSFQTYASQDSSTSTTTVMATSVILKTLPITFTLPRAASVILTLDASVSSGVTETKASNVWPYAQFFTAIAVSNSDGAYSVQNTYQDSSNLIISTVTSVSLLSQYQNSLTQTRITQLPSGTNTITGSVRVYMLGDSGNANVNNLSINATVIG